MRISTIIMTWRYFRVNARDRADLLHVRRAPIAVDRLWSVIGNRVIDVSLQVS